MLDLRSHILVPEQGIDDDGKIIVTRDEISALLGAIQRAAQQRISICHIAVQNGEQIVFLADFCNHGDFALTALREIEGLLRPYEDRLKGQLKAHLYAYDDEENIIIDLQVGSPYSPIV
ncbi:MAG: hypothetical protein R3D99_04725 [Altererythrobacter sp.]